MGAGVDEQILAGGQLFSDGTELGRILDVAMIPRTRATDRTGFELGGQTTGATYRGIEWTVTVALVNWDADALAAMGFSVSTGTSGAPVVTYPGTALKIGANLASMATRLVLKPFDTRDPQLTPTPGFVLDKAMPRFDGSGPLRFSTSDPLIWLCTWVGIGGWSDRIASLGNHGDLSL